MNLKRQLSNSTAWMSLAASGMSIVSFLVFIVISRLLSPAEIGLAVFAILVVELGKIIINGGLSQAIVQRSEWDQDYASTCFTLNLISGAIFTALVWFVGVPLTRAFYTPDAVPVLQVLCVIFLIEAIKIVHEGKLRREFQFKLIAVRTVAASIASGVVGVALAFQGYGVWALVAQQITGQLLVSVITLYSAHWWPTLTVKIALARQALGFSAPLMISQLVNALATTLMEFMVGVILGPIQLAIYRIGGRALFILQDIIVRPFEQTSLPALARMTNKSERALATLRIMRLSNFIIVPVFFGVSAVASDFITLVFGEKWQQSGELMCLLALGSAPLLIRFQINAALIAQGASRWVMSTTLLTLLLTFVLGYIAIPYGLRQSALTYVAINYLASLLNIFSFRYIYQSNISAIFKAVLPSYIASGIMLAGCMLIKTNLPDELGEVLRILILCLSGGLIYVLLAALVFRSETKNLLQESLSIAPAKMSWLLVRIQSWLRLV